jgi:multidrug efflux pump subunit AcrB
LLIRNQHEPALLLGIVMREGWNGLALGKALDAETAKSMPACRWACP